LSMDDFWSRQSNAQKFSFDFAPFGVPCEITANDPAALAAAQLSSRRYSRAETSSVSKTLRVSIVVSQRDTPPVPADLSERLHYAGVDDWITVAAGEWGHGFANLQTRSAFVFLSPALAAETRLVSRYFIDHYILNLLLTEWAMLHASCVMDPSGERLIVMIAPLEPARRDELHPTLEQIVKKAGKLDPENVCWIVERSVNALKYIHYHGVVHGDVKPQNIIIQPESHNIVLVDYGLSIIRPSSGSGAIGYTPYFASPEQERGDTLLPESDFYSLGMTMIYALGGDIATKRVPSNVPDPVCSLIKNLIKYDVSGRPNWESEDLVDTIQTVRKKAFGRTNSGMKPIPGF